MTANPAKKGNTRTQPGLLLTIGSIFVALLLAEAFLQIIGFARPIQYSVWPLGLEQVIIPDERDTPGIAGPPHVFRITALGYRGRPIGHARLNVAAFGGSTTESLFVPEEHSWPRLLENDLGSNLNTTVWVGNFGKSGRNTRQHVLDAKYVLPQFSACVALFLAGVNDLAVPLGDPAAQPMTIDEIQSDSYMRRSLVVSDGGQRRLKLLDLIRGVQSLWNRKEAAPELIHVSTEFYRTHRKERSERAGYSSQIPELDPFLDEYARNLAAIADLVSEQGKIPVFISQPSLWSSTVPADVDARFWWGAVDGWPPRVAGGYYYSSDALDRMLTRYNDRLRLVGKQKNVALIDAATKLPKDPAYFYDQVHYNVAGSQAMSRLIAGELSMILKQNGLEASNSARRAPSGCTR